MALFTAQLDDQLSQGDVFRPDWDNDRAATMGSVIVVSWGSEIDKSDTILVANTVADGDTEAGLRGHIQAGRVWHALHLAGLGRSVTFWTIRPAAKLPFAAGLAR